MWKSAMPPAVYKGSLGTMQSFSCNSQLPNVHEYGTVTDSRDNNQYTVARLMDGRCWMTQNLKIMGRSISSSNSDMTSGSFTIPSSAKWTSGNLTTNSVYYDSNYGAYYTWYTATAGSSASLSQGQSATSSICPKGWQLPTGTSGGNFEQLISLYTTPDKITATPIPNFIFSGFYTLALGGMITSTDTLGLYWSSTLLNSTSNNGNVVALSFNKSSVSIGSGTIFNGSLVRCIAKSSCFTAGTMVDTPNGYIPIENIKEGTIVYSYDLENNTIVEDEVTKKIVSSNNQTVILTFEDGSTIHATNVHPFYDLDKREWKMIGDFKPGDKLRTIDGTVSVVANIEKDPKNETVYNFTTEHHNYFIISKDTNNRYLVHNKEPK